MDAANIRLLEDAADECARLDQAFAPEPAGITLAFWLAAIADVDSTRPSLDALVAAAADPIHDPAVGAALLSVRAFVASEERRLRSGSSLALARWEVLAPGLATYPNRHRLEAVWRAPGRDRPVLERAIESAAWMDDPSVSGDGLDVAGLAFALLLCAGGRTAHLRFQPLSGIDGSARQAASEAFRSGDASAWAALSLETPARNARRTREAIAGLGAARARDDAALEMLGRAGINARRTLEHLRQVLASTVPVAAGSLDLSRPAASAALERLVEAGVAREVTGRSRDRVFAWAAPLDLVGQARRA